MRLPNDEILHYKSDDGVSVVVERTELVRCKDCIHNDQCKHRVVMWVEDPINTWHKDIDFCSYGERKEQERNIFLDESIDETAGYGKEQEHGA